MAEVTPKQEMFLAYLEETGCPKQAAAQMGLGPASGMVYARKLKDEILERSRDKLIGLVFKAVNTTEELMDANVDTVKGELRLKASDSVLDRTGLTKHTNVEVSVESTNGLFILPSKDTVGPEDPDETEDTEDNE